jgi:hypothetical protein
MALIAYIEHFYTSFADTVRLAAEVRGISMRHSLPI